MIKVAINTINGGWELSKEAYEFLGLEWDDCGCAYENMDSKTRTDPKLIKCIETLGDKVNGWVGSKIKIVEIPDDIDFWIIEDYGKEHIEEKHRIWYYKNN